MDVIILEYKFSIEVVKKSQWEKITPKMILFNEKQYLLKYSEMFFSNCALPGRSGVVDQKEMQVHITLLWQSLLIL